MSESSGEQFDRSAELISDRVALELKKFQDQVINPGLIDAVRQRVAENIGGIIGLGESTEIFGVSKQRALQLLDATQDRQTPPPSPIARLKATPVWFKADVEDYQDRRLRRQTLTVDTPSVTEAEVVDLTPELAVPQTEIINQHSYSFRGITNPDDVLVREHFEDLGTIGTVVTTRNYIQAFHKMLDQHGRQSTLYAFVGPRKQQMREPMPMNDIQVVKRADINLPPYKKPLGDKEAQILAQYGITAGSALRALEWTSQLNLEKANQTQKALGDIAARLLVQLTPSDQVTQKDVT